MRRRRRNIHEFYIKSAVRVQSTARKPGKGTGIGSSTGQKTKNIEAPVYSFEHRSFLLYKMEKHIEKY